ncbi:MAG: hypothetical protein GY696_39520, partial [Gammaproteobacteria bacterium]|nr:hypothetical protein [Gammaproteobacteria bacterium]
MDDESRPLTTMITPLGLRQYKSLPMGLKDSAEGFVELKLKDSFNKYLKYGVQAMGKKAWSEGLSALLNAYRIPQEKGKSPAELFWRREIRPDAVPNRSQHWRRIRLDRRNPAEMVDQEIRPFLGPNKYHRGD